MTRHPLTIGLIFFLCMPFMVTVAQSLGWGITGVLIGFIIAAIVAVKLSETVHILLERLGLFNITPVEDFEEDEEQEEPLPIRRTRRGKAPSEKEEPIYSLPPLPRTSSNPPVYYVPRVPFNEPMYSAPPSASNGMRYAQGYQQSTPKAPVGQVKQPRQEEMDENPQVMPDRYEQPMAEYPQEIPPYYT